MSIQSGIITFGKLIVAVIKYPAFQTMAGIAKALGVSLDDLALEKQTGK